MKTVRFSLVIVGVALLLVLFTMTAAADDPILVAKATTPIGAPYIDNLAHPIPANADVWNHFDYALSSSRKPQMTTLRLLYGNISGVGFEIYEPSDMNAYADKGLAPIIGRGVPEMMLCSTGLCAGDDLVWYGALGATGSYYVRIINPTPFATTYLLTVNGNGVSVVEPIVLTGPIAATSSRTQQDPTRAVVLDGKQQTIPAQSAGWYSFDYKPSDIKTVRLLYGNKSGMHFEVYSPEILNNWWENDPIGVGLPQMVVCSTGWCQGDDLTWTGAFGMKGTYFIRVINDFPFDMPALLTIE